MQPENTMSALNFAGGFGFGLFAPFAVLAIDGGQRLPSTCVALVLCFVVGLLFNLRKD
jgi:hypothetical protein